MDFALLPPEVNSGLMYSGPGAGPLLAAATSWDALAVELQTVGTAYDATIADLNDGWSGPSAAAMAAAATPYAKWMHTTSAQAQQTAAQAKAAAAAYETAFAMTVPPAVIAANRAQLMVLLATNFLGQNTPAIAATEAHYAEMWAQDATAMYTYAHSAAAASSLTPITPPPQTTDPTRTITLAEAVGRTAAATAGSRTATGVLAGIHTLQGLSSPAAATPPPDVAALLATLVPAATSGTAAIHLALAGSELVVDTIGTFGVDVLGTFLIDALGATVIWEELLPLGGLIGSVAPATASAGGATLVGGLSVPQAWTVTATSAVQHAGPPPAATAGAPAVGAGEMVIPFAGITAAGLGGRATAAVSQGGGKAASTTKPQRRASQQNQPKQRRVPVYGLINGVDIELRELAELRAASVLTEDEYTQQKRRLLGR